MTKLITIVCCLSLVTIPSYAYADTVDDITKGKVTQLRKGQEAGAGLGALQGNEVTVHSAPRSDLQRLD